MSDGEASETTHMHNARDIGAPAPSAHTITSPCSSNPVGKFGYNYIRCSFNDGMGTMMRCYGGYELASSVHSASKMETGKLCEVGVRYLFSRGRAAPMREGQGCAQMVSGAE